MHHMMHVMRKNLRKCVQFAAKVVNAHVPFTLALWGWIEVGGVNAYLNLKGARLHKGETAVSLLLHSPSPHITLTSSSYLLTILSLSYLN